MNVPPDYVLPSDADIEAASRVGGAALVSLRGGASNGQPVALPDIVWIPFLDVLILDAAHPIPEQRIPYFAWAGRVTIISGEAKAGKSTVLGQAICAALDGGSFAGTTVPRLSSIAIATEEPLELVAARLRHYGLSSPAHDGKVWVCSPREGIDRLLAAVVRQKPEVLLIDSLTEWALHRRAASMNDALAMRAIVNDLRLLSEAGVAVSVVHHGRKADGELRDSGDLAASADLLVSFDAVDFDGKVVSFRTSNLRRLSAVGRWPVDTTVLGFRDSEYYVDSVAPR